MKFNPIRFGPNEWTGALGDLGTFAPLFLGLVAACGIAPGRMLLLFGAAYICAGLAFRLPMPVQPLKAMAAIAVAGHLSAAHLAAGALWMGAILCLLAITGRIRWLERFFPPPVVKGVQLGAGLLLLKAAWSLLQGSPWGGAAHMSYPWGFPTPAVLWTSLWLLVLPQIPLTLGNAVYAISDTAKSYFGDGARRVTPTGCALSIGAINLIIGLLGGVPICHGSGGLTAHYRFGARTAGATILLGGFFVTLALWLGDASPAPFAALPPWLLAGAVAYVGACHVWLLKGLKERHVVALLMGAIALMTANLTYALVAGLALDRLIVILISGTDEVAGLQGAK